jgi:hypothetical protein
MNGKRPFVSLGNMAAVENGRWPAAYGVLAQKMLLITITTEVLSSNKIFCYHIL